MDYKTGRTTQDENQESEFVKDGVSNEPKWVEHGTSGNGFGEYDPRHPVNMPEVHGGSDFGRGEKADFSNPLTEERQGRDSAGGNPYRSRLK